MSLNVADREIELDDAEVRVIGCLIEKELSTPDYYPMTVNALTAACNQKTNREPVVSYSESEVAETLERLQRKRLVGSASGSHGRAGKYRHALAEIMGLEPPQLAVLASLMLRGPETAGAIRSRSSRMHDFASLELVNEVLVDLAEGDAPLITALAIKPGQKEARYTHLFAGAPDENPESARSGRTDSGDRVSALEEEVEVLKQRVDDLADAFHAFRKQFE